MFATTSEDEDDDDDSGAGAGADAPAAASTATPARGWLAVPAPSRHVAFDGRYLHGVPAELLDVTLDASSPPSSQRGADAVAGSAAGDAPPPLDQRLSVLVNVWTSHKPAGLGLMPASLLAALAEDGGGGGGGGDHHSLASAALVAPARVAPCLAHVAAGVGAAVAEARAEAVAETPIAKAARTTALAPPRVLQLREHREGDTGRLPLAALRACLRAGGAMEIQYGGGSDMGGVAPATTS